MPWELTLYSVGVSDMSLEKRVVDSLPGWLIANASYTPMGLIEELEKSPEKEVYSDTIQWLKSTASYYKVVIIRCLKVATIAQTPQPVLKLLNDFDVKDCTYVVRIYKMADVLKPGIILLSGCIDLYQLYSTVKCEAILHICPDFTKYETEFKFTDLSGRDTFDAQRMLQNVDWEGDDSDEPMARLKHVEDNTSLLSSLHMHLRMLHFLLDQHKTNCIIFVKKHGCI